MSVLWLSLIVVILKLLYDIYVLSITNIQITDPEFELLDPENSEQTEFVEDIYEKLIDLNNFTFIQKPELCVNSTALLLVIIISSLPMNFERRTTIRNTWGRSDDAIKVVFLVGVSNDTMISRDVENESTIFRDIVQGSFLDVYRNNTYKHVMGLKWVFHHCPMAKYVLKVNDDVFVQTYALRHFLARELSPWGAKRLIICRVRKYVVPQRFHGLPNRVSSKEYPEWYYPPHCLGLVILYSHDVVCLLLKAAQSAPYFWIDDVHLTGILTKKMQLKLTSANSLIPRPWHWDFKRKKFLFGYLNMSMSDMKWIWRYVASWE